MISVIFYLAALLLAALAVWIIVPVILREPGRQDSNRVQENIVVARQRLEELRQRESSGEIDPQDAAQIREEIESELLSDVGDSSADETALAAENRGRAAKLIAAAVAVLIPVCAGVMYLLVGEPGGVAISPSAEVAQVQEAAPVSEAAEDAMQNLDQLTQRLLGHLAENSDDALGWRTLGQLFVAQQRFAEAAGAFRQVRGLEGDSAEFLVREADALAMARNGVLQGQPEVLIQTALELDPNHTGGLWLAGLAAGERGDVRAALDFWKRAEGTTQNEELLAEIRRLIESGTAELARLGDSAVSGEAQSAGPVIRVQVSIDPFVLEEVSPEDVVFVFARAFNGPPAPLAVLKMQVKDLPITADLDDSMAMLPNLNISSFEQVFVVARVSFSGAPKAQSGDYFGQSEPIRPGVDQDLVEIAISERVP